MFSVLLVASCLCVLREACIKIVGKPQYGNVVYLFFGSLVPRFVEYFFYQNPGLLDPTRCGEPGLSRYEENVITVSAGYFLQTTFTGWRIGEDWYLQFHHVFCLVTIATPLYTDCCAFELFVLLWLGEFTTPCAFWIFFYEKNKTMREWWLLIVNKMVYFVFFVVLRFGVGSYFLWVLLYSNTLLVVKVSCVFMVAFNLHVLVMAVGEMKSYARSFRSRQLRKTQ